MKQFLIFLVVLALLGAGGYMGYNYLLSQQSNAPAVEKYQGDTLVGKLLPGKGDDYTFVLMDTKGKTTGVTTQTVDLSLYVNKNVEVTGQYSGTTLYIDTITEK